MRMLMRWTLGAVALLGVASVASSAPQKTQLHFKGAGARLSGLSFDDCLAYNFVFEGNEVMSKEGGSPPNQEAGALVGVSVFDLCTSSPLVSGMKFLTPDDFKASMNGAEASVSFEAQRVDGGQPSVVEVDFSAEWTPSGPIYSTKINEHSKFGDTIFHEIRSGDTRSATASGTITIDALGLESGFSGAFGELTVSSSGLLIVSHE